MNEDTQDERLYIWIPRSEIVFFQSLLDAEEGLARVRTERQEDSKALLLLMFTRSRKAEVLDWLRHFQQAYEITLESV